MGEDNELFNKKYNKYIIYELWRVLKQIADVFIENKLQAKDFKEYVTEMCPYSPKDCNYLYSDPKDVLKQSDIIVPENSIKVDYGELYENQKEIEKEIDDKPIFM